MYAVCERKVVKRMLTLSAIGEQIWYRRPWTFDPQPSIFLSAKNAVVNFHVYVAWTGRRDIPISLIHNLLHFTNIVF